MALLTFAIACYFAAVLGVSGLVKVDDPQYFVTVLRQQRLLPAWSVQTASRVLPWGEIIVALFLLTGILPLATAIMLLGLCMLFLGVKSTLLLLGRTEDCGCFGKERQQKIDGPSIVVSAILVALAAFHTWLVLTTPPLAWFWRLAGALPLLGIGCYMLGNILVTHLRTPKPLLDQAIAISGLAPGTLAPDFTALDQDGNPLRLEGLNGKRRILAFVTPDCPSCAGIFTAIQEVLSHHPGLVALIIGSADEASNRDYVAQHAVQLPFLTPPVDLVEHVYQVDGFPLVFALNEQGIILGKAVVNITEHLQDLIMTAYAPQLIQVGGKTS